MRRPTLKTVALIGLGLGSLIIALTGGWSVMYRVTYILVALLLVSSAWAYIGARTLNVERRVRAQRAQVGGFFEEWVAVDNTSWLPKPWAEIQSQSNLGAHAVRKGFALGPKARRSWTIHTECTIRGKFKLGDIVVSTGDPFGLFQRQVQFPSETTVLIYPRTVDFATPPHIPGQLPGGARQSGHVHYVTPTASSVREYQPADAFNRIHWPSTARTGKLMVKEFELDPFADVWIAIDFHREVHAGRGAESTEEYAVTVAASFARYFLMQNRSVGLLTQHEVIPPDRGTRQLTKIFELLAIARADRWQSFDELLSGESMRLNRLATLVAVTPSVDLGWVEVTEHLVERGVDVLVPLIESATFGGSANVTEAVAALATANIPTYLVKRGQPLENLLTNPVVGHVGRGAPDGVMHAT
jgi:uncharacterized protein (DUF58 family)